MGSDSQCRPSPRPSSKFQVALLNGPRQANWYLLPMRAAKVQASLRIRAVSPEPSLLAHTSSESRGTFRQKARPLAPLNGCACAVEICHDGMLEDTNSLDGAQMVSCKSKMLQFFKKFFQNGQTFLKMPTVTISQSPSARNILNKIRPKLALAQNWLDASITFTIQELFFFLFKCQWIYHTEICIPF